MFEIFGKDQEFGLFLFANFHVRNFASVHVRLFQEVNRQTKSAQLWSDSNFLVCPVLILCENSLSWPSLHLGIFDRQACPTCLATSLQPDTCVSDDGVHQQPVSSAKDFEHVVGVQCSSGRRSVKQHSSWHSRWGLTDAVSSHVGLGASAVSPSSLVPQFLCWLSWSWCSSDNVPCEREECRVTCGDDVFMVSRCGPS